MHTCKLSHHHRLVWCLRSLSGLTASGLALDKYGLLQLSSPNLGDVLDTLLGVVVVLRAYIKHTVRGRYYSTCGLVLVQWFF